MKASSWETFPRIKAEAVGGCQWAHLPQAAWSQLGQRSVWEEGRCCAPVHPGRRWYPCSVSCSKYVWITSPFPSGPTHFSTAGVVSGCQRSCQPHKLSTVGQGRCHVATLCHQERSPEPDGTEEILCGRRSTRWRLQCTYSQAGAGACSMRILLKKERYTLSKWREPRDNDQSSLWTPQLMAY